MRTLQLGYVVAVMVSVVAGRCAASHGADPTRGAISDDEATPQREAGNEEPAVRPLTVNRTGPEPSPAIAPFDAEQARKHQEASAKHLGLPLELTNSVGMKFVLIPPGEFMMGSAESPEELAKAFPETPAKYLRHEQPQHRVRITRPFCLGVNEVTVGQFRQFVEAADYRTDAERESKGGRGRRGMGWSWGPEFTGRTFGIPQPDTYPVLNVSWNDAVAFCQWLSGKEGRTYRLPTEAEWEYACRAGTTTRFCFGDDESSLGDYAWYSGSFGERERRTHPVGQKRPNAWGMYDMHGNVWEWCQDWFGLEYYGKSPPEDPAGPATGYRRVRRGGCWLFPAWDCRSARRLWSVPGGRDFFLGFRVAAVPSGE